MTNQNDVLKHEIEYIGNYRQQVNTLVLFQRDYETVEIDGQPHYHYIRQMIIETDSQAIRDKI